MDCPDCGMEMVWQNDWDLSEERGPDEPDMLTTYCCFNDECDVESIDIHRKTDC